VRVRTRVLRFYDLNKERILKALRLKPFLRYVEVHLVDHCNLNCGGCSHFSPIAREWFADVDQYEKDMHRLAELFRNVNTVRLMGGEPLLHPQIESFVTITRHYLPKADVRVVTNGLLLPAMQEPFWEICRSNSVVLMSRCIRL
jgi:molybdenum cofactor biosynthesis enzyme MoaA